MLHFFYNSSLMKKELSEIFNQVDFSIHEWAKQVLFRRRSKGPKDELKFHLRFENRSKLQQKTFPKCVYSIVCQQAWLCKGFFKKTAAVQGIT